MTTLTDFLLARIAEDEERATFVQRQVADGRGPETLEPWHLSWHDEYDLLCVEPERVLAECEAKRRIVEARAGIGIPEGADIPPGGGLVWLDGAHTAVGVERDRTFRLLAQPYADHPEFRPEWRL